MTAFGRKRRKLDIGLIDFGLHIERPNIRILIATSGKKTGEANEPNKSHRITLPLTERG
jgi:hypothetical protein